MDFTKPKSIFDIPKTILVEPPPRRVVKRRKSKKVKKVKGAKAGGVEVSQKRNYRGQREITLKHKGGLTQQITIYTGDQKPRGHKAKGQTANWNMKPAKFKKSRGLRDDRVYLQPPKREYFGNRYKSAIEEQKINQKVKEAGASKNKEIASVRETANIQKRELERREASKEKTITELQRSAAGLVASHNVAVRNQSQATILGGDVGELNKLIDRRGVGSIRQLILKGEISDASTIYQLNLTPDAIDKMIRTLETEKQTFVGGAKLVWISANGISKTGRLVRETDKFVFIRKDDGEVTRVPKGLIQRGADVAQSRSRSRSESVRRGEGSPAAEDFGGGTVEEREELRRTVSDVKERPAWRKSARRNDFGGASPRDRSAEPPRFSAEPNLEEEIVRLSPAASTRAEVRAAPAVSEDEFKKSRVILKKGISKEGITDVIGAEESGGETGYEDAIADADALLAESDAPEEPEPAPEPEPEPDPDPFGRFAPVEAEEDVKPKKGRRTLGQKIPKKTEATVERSVSVVPQGDYPYPSDSDDDTGAAGDKIRYVDRGDIELAEQLGDTRYILLIDTRKESITKNGNRPAVYVSTKKLQRLIEKEFKEGSKVGGKISNKIDENKGGSYRLANRQLLDNVF